MNQTYWANGATDSLTGYTPTGTLSYGAIYALDGVGRVNSVGYPAGSTSILSSTTYNTANEPLQVNFASGDSDTFQYDAMNRMNKYTFSVNGQSVVGAPTWNANGSLGNLAITDPFNSANAQNCTYTHDDLGRLANATCTGSGFSGTYSYDAFGNLAKSGTDTFQASYNPATNQMTSVGSQTPSYDADGRVLNDLLNSYSWDTYGRPTTVDSVGITYDALGRMVEENKSSAYSQFVYSPTGFKMEIMNSGNLVTAFAPLSGGTVQVYEAGGFIYYRHSDWLGSSRLASTTGRAVYYDGAYGPFGEPYAESGTTDLSFTGMNQDTASNVYDFPAREYGIQGRWPSPDPAGLAAVNPMDPQTWNRYAYVRNSPLRYVDPLGLDPCGPIDAVRGRPHANLVLSGCGEGGGGGDDGFGGAMDWNCDEGMSVPTAICGSGSPNALPPMGGGGILVPGDCYDTYIDGGYSGNTCDGEESAPLPTGGGGSHGVAPSRPPQKPQTQTAQQKDRQCLNQINNTPDGKFYNFFSLASPFIGPNKLESLGEDTLGFAAKYGGYKGLRYVADNDIALPELSPLVADSIPWVAKKVVLPLSLASTAAQVTVHVGCSITSHF